jgi:hypothetical protein
VAHAQMQPASFSASSAHAPLRGAHRSIERGIEPPQTHMPLLRSIERDFECPLRPSRHLGLKPNYELHGHTRRRRRS